MTSALFAVGVLRPDTNMHASVEDQTMLTLEPLRTSEDTSIVLEKDIKYTIDRKKGTIVILEVINECNEGSRQE